MHILNLVCFSAILLPFSQLSAEVSTTETKTNNLKNQHLLVRKADFIEENQWTTEASFLTGQRESHS